MVRPETKAAVLQAMKEVGRNAQAAGMDALKTIERTFPGAPVEVHVEAWLAVVDEATQAWWEQVENTIDAEVVKDALRLVGGKAA